MSNWAPEQAVLALRLQPSNVELISLVASARMQDGDRKGALKVLRRALKIAPSDASLNATPSLDTETFATKHGAIVSFIAFASYATSSDARGSVPSPG